MNILISGASGLVGRALMQSLSIQDHQVLALRRDTTHTAPFWGDIDRQIIELGPDKQVDAVINLAGENIADNRWTVARKERIRQSRVDSTRLLAQFFAQADYKPKVIISASAVGIYGDRGDEELTEASSIGTGFLAHVAQEWEAAAQPARAAGIRVVNLRFGIVLSTEGGALAKMLPPFKLGLGGVMGSGKQWMSWISRDEIPHIIKHILQHEELHGPVNAVSPCPATNREFTKALSKVLCRPALLPAPRFLLELLLGEMGRELLFASTKVTPSRLLASGYVFREPDLATTLNHLLRKV
ncbi:TIGR01777 family oxidoreductase [Desulfobulbus sp. F5]|nr:TIGR01777 family oxidoreductase [Desulfobulbus sp. F5]